MCVVVAGGVLRLDVHGELRSSSRRLDSWFPVSGSTPATPTNLPGYDPGHSYRDQPRVHHTQNHVYSAHRDAREDAVDHPLGYQLKQLRAAAWGGGYAFKTVIPF